jgi:hypothetical protein
MGIIEVRKALESVKEAREDFADVFSIEDYEIIITENSVYRGVDIACSRMKADERFLKSLEIEGSPYRKLEPSVYRLGEKGSLTIVKGGYAFILEEWKGFTHEGFLKNLESRARR